MASGECVRVYREHVTKRSHGGAHALGGARAQALGGDARHARDTWTGTGGLGGCASVGDSASTA